jgi:hypothetical protein
MRFPAIWDQLFVVAVAGLSQNLSLSSRTIAIEARDIADAAHEIYLQKMDETYKLPEVQPEEEKK